MADPKLPENIQQPEETNADTMNLELHLQAEEQLRKFTEEYFSALLLQSRALAITERANVVLSTHIEEAKDIVISREKNKGKGREILIILGSAMIGTFLQGFPTEMANDTIRRSMIIFNVIMGVIGMLLLVWGLAKKT